jgi:hypothetical protein
MEEKSAGFVEFLYAGEVGRPPPRGNRALEPFGLGGQIARYHWVAVLAAHSYNLLRVFD